MGKNHLLPAQEPMYTCAAASAHAQLAFTAVLLTASAHVLEEDIFPGQYVDAGKTGHLSHYKHMIRDQSRARVAHLAQCCRHMLLALGNVGPEVPKDVKEGAFPVQLKVCLVGMPQPCLPVQALQKSTTYVSHAGLLAATNT